MTHLLISMAHATVHLLICMAYVTVHLLISVASAEYFNDSFVDWHDRC